MFPPGPVKLPVKELCPNGDLMLLVGKNPVHPFLVSRTVLTSTSPVFSAMLTGNFSEATKKEIDLEDNDAGALLTVLRIAHLRFHEVAGQIGMDEMVIGNNLRQVRHGGDLSTIHLRMGRAVSTHRAVSLQDRLALGYFGVGL